MANKTQTESQRVRAKLSHPVIDCDGHIIEITPVLVDFIRQVGGAKMAEAYMKQPAIGGFYHQRDVEKSPAQHKETWLPMGHWWGQPVDALDRATLGLPNLLAQRLDDFGIDFCILYPSEGLFAASPLDPDVRRAVVRGYNTYVAEMYNRHRDRMTPVAVIPMHTPEEAVEELDYAVNKLGLRAAVFSMSVRRPIPATPSTSRMELFGVDSDFNYDKVWAKAAELKVAVTFHGGIGGMGTSSISNYAYNHVGLLAQSHQRLAKALLVGGVYKRFPGLRFAYLEAGAAWAIQCYADLIGHWEKRNGKAIKGLNPDLIDRDQFMRLVAEHGDARIKGLSTDIRAFIDRKLPHPQQLDDFAAAGIKTAKDIHDQFVPRSFFGCEADDPINAFAFNTKVNPFGATMQIIYGTDIGHWDVPVMADVLHEAWEMVEHDAINLDQFKQFVFTNGVSLHAGSNPDFFKGTRVEAEVGKLLKKR